MRRNEFLDFNERSYAPFFPERSKLYNGYIFTVVYLILFSIWSITPYNAITRYMAGYNIGSCFWQFIFDSLFINLTNAFIYYALSIQRLHHISPYVMIMTFVGIMCISIVYGFYFIVGYSILFFIANCLAFYNIEKNNLLVSV